MPMDYAERGTVEKTLDRLIEDGSTIADGLDPELGELVDGDEFTGEGRAYLTGLLSGILATVRTFSEGESGFDEEDVEEIRRIARGREGELLAAVAEGEE